MRKGFWVCWTLSWYNCFFSSYSWIDNTLSFFFSNNMVLWHNMLHWQSGFWVSADYIGINSFQIHNFPGKKESFKQCMSDPLSWNYVPQVTWIEIIEFISKLSHSQFTFIKNICTYLSKIFVLFSRFRKKRLIGFLFHTKSYFRSWDNTIFVTFLLPSIFVEFEGAIEAKIIMMLWIGFHIQYNTDNSNSQNRTSKKSNWFCVPLKPTQIISHKNLWYLELSLFWIGTYLSVSTNNLNS